MPVQKVSRLKPGYTGLTSDDLASYLRREFSSDEKNQATFLISSIESEIAWRCNRQFDHEVVYQEFFDLPSNKFFTSAFPIASIELIKIDGIEATLLENSDYWIYDSYIEFDNFVFSGEKVRKGLEIQYKIDQFWGDDVKLLVLSLAGQAWLNAEDGGLGKTEFGFASVRSVFDTAKFAKDVQAVINRYRKRLV